MPGRTAWKGQKRLLEGGLPDRDRVIKRIMDVEDPRDRFICALAYLTGARATELTDLEKSRIWKEDIKGKECVIFRLTNRKSKRHKEKMLAVAAEDEPELCGIVVGFVSNFQGDILTPGTQQAMYHIIKKSLGWNPHFMRHIRLTHLTVNRGYSEIKLTRWAGWTDSRPASTYVKYRYPDFID